MADSAVSMAKSGCKFISVLGVDFMSENVRAILDQAGFPEVGVYRMSDEQIGCSLADAASSPAYMNYLSEASSSSPSLHVVYINTSLETKAHAHELVPTITCTSSNVVQTILQCPTQPGSSECGYYVLNFMKEVVREGIQILVNDNVGGGKGIYTETDLDTVREEWSSYASQFIFR